MIIAGALVCDWSLSLSESMMSFKGGYLQPQTPHSVLQLLYLLSDCDKILLAVLFDKGIDTSTSTSTASKAGFVSSGVMCLLKALYNMV